MVIKVTIKCVYTVKYSLYIYSTLELVRSI